MKQPVTILTALLLLAGLCLPASVNAAEKAPSSESGLPIPRFISISSKTANMRTGPGKRYPVVWIYKRPGVPVMVTAEFEHWRKVLDVDGAEGWIHKSLLSGKRTAIVSGKLREFRISGETNAPVVFLAEPGVIGRLETCAGSWCRMEIGDRNGWIERAYIFGALPNEDFD